MADSRLSAAIQTLVKVFHEYAAKDEAGKGKTYHKEACMDQFKLSKRELKELMLKEFNYENVKNPADLEKLMTDLDDNEDGQVDFQEFVVFVVTMACVCNDFVQDILTEKKKEEEEQDSV